MSSANKVHKLGGFLAANFDQSGLVAVMRRWEVRSFDIGHFRGIVLCQTEEFVSIVKGMAGIEMFLGRRSIVTVATEQGGSRMKTLMVLTAISMFTAGCAATGPADKTREAVINGSALVYRHIKPVPAQATIKFSKDGGKVRSSLTDADWLKELNYRDIGVGAGELVRAITAPNAFPFSILFSSIDPIADVFKQERDVRLKELDVATQVERREVWMPKGAKKVHVAEAELDVEVEGI